MGKKKEDSEERQLVKIDDMSLEETQLAEQLYNSAGLDPVVDAGLKDYGKHLQQEDKLIIKVFGPRGSDIKGYGEAVARRVSFAVYALLNKQYGGKVGDLRSYIMTLEDERDRANTRYDELMGRVVGILGEEYKELRTDSNAFMEKLTTILGEDVKESRIDHKALAEKLADIDGLRAQIGTLEEEKEGLKERHESQVATLLNEHSEEVQALKTQIRTLAKEKEELKERHESQIAALRNEHSEEVQDLRTQIAELDSKIEGLASEKAALAGDLVQLTEDYKRLKKAATTLAGAIPHEEIGRNLEEESFSFLLKDSKVPHMVIDGVGKFIDFRKYLGLAAARGAKEATRQSEQTLRNALSE